MTTNDGNEHAHDNNALFKSYSRVKELYVTLNTMLSKGGEGVSPETPELGAINAELMNIEQTILANNSLELKVFRMHKIEKKPLYQVAEECMISYGYARKLSARAGRKWGAANGKA